MCGRRSPFVNPFVHIVASEDKWLHAAGLRYCCRILPHPRPAFEPTLFLSGAFQTMDSWVRFARVFAPVTTVLLVDPPGMGQSDLLPAEFGVDFLARSIRQLADEHRFDRINIVAASYGTPAALRFAQLFPCRVARIVLAGTMKEIPAHIRARVADSVVTALRGDRERLAGQVIDGLLCRDPHVPVDRRELAARVLRNGITRMSKKELEQYACNTRRLLQHESLDLSAPVRGPEALVFTGEHDCFTTPTQCREVADAFENAWFTTVKRADHLFHIEQFATVSALLLRFLHGTLAGAPSGCSVPERAGCAASSAA